MVEAFDSDTLVKQYKLLLSDLLLRRATEGPLSEIEEARLAQDRADLWGEIPEERLTELQEWVVQEMRRTASLSSCG